MKRAVLLVVIILAVGAGAGAWYYRRGETELHVNTAPLSRGDIVDTVGATGTLQAVTTVQVGSQVSGNIQWLGADFNSIVKQGQVIARLDPSLFDAQLQQTQANLTQARANLVKGQSELERARVQLVDAEQKYTRANELSTRQLLPASELDAAKIAVDTAKAAVASQQATVTQVQAAVTQSQASVNQSQVNRDHTVIVAPIDGIVTQRNVDVGQTVAASMQAPTLFIIAADLTEMQVNANIDEADVGRIRPGQHVTFRVDAYPTDNFQGTVTQVRLQPVVVQNVTTYGTVITVPNTELKLKPGMTANVKIEIARRSNTLRVPNAALRFRATQEIFTALNQTPPPEATAFANAGRGGRGGRGAGGAPDAGMQPPAAGNRTASAPAVAAAQAPSQPAGSASASPPPSAAGPSPGSSAGTSASAEPSGRGGRGGGSGEGGIDGGSSGGFRRNGGGGDDGGGGFRGGRGGDPAQFQARMLERFKSMSPDEQTQFIARMKQRGVDTSAFEKAKPAGAAKKRGAPANPQGAQTIDALFAPLPPVESRVRAWLFIDKQLKPVNLRLGITDGTYTELLSGELQETAELVTGVTGLGPTRSTITPGGSGNPLMPGRGPGGPGGGRGPR
jgi:HlyD family secretion protein